MPQKEAGMGSVRAGAEAAVARSDKEWVNRVFSKIFFFKERLNVRCYRFPFSPRPSSCHPPAPSLPPCPFPTSPAPGASLGGGLAAQSGQVTREDHGTAAALANGHPKEPPLLSNPRQREAGSAKRWIFRLQQPSRSILQHGLQWPSGISLAPSRY